MVCGFESLREHQLSRRKTTALDPRKYIKIRIDQLTQERAKNNDNHTHLILDKSIAELSIVLDLLERKAPL